MKTVDLSKVLEMLINEEHDEATGLLHEWFVERSKAVHEGLMAEDNTLSQDIEDDQEAIESEEYYNEADEDSDAEGEELDGDLDMDADADVADDMDGDVDMDAPVDASPETAIADTIENLEDVMARLKAEFAELTGDVDAGVDADADADLDGMEPVDMGDLDGGAEADVEGDDDDFAVGEGVMESDEDNFDDLEESWTLEPVKDPNLNGGKEIGADGAKVAVNNKSPLPEHDGPGRVGGKAVEIHSDHHEGHEREPSPEVKAKPLLKNQVKKATDGRTKVSKEGDKSATLNSKAGFGSDSPKSPIGAGATDLRGSDFKRK